MAGDVDRWRVWPVYPPVLAYCLLEKRECKCPLCSHRFLPGLLAFIFSSLQRIIHTQPSSTTGSPPSGKDVKFFYTLVLDLVNYARTCYVEDSTDEYDDPIFAQMLLLDAAFIINFIVLHRDAERLEITGIHLGDLVYAVLWRDLLLLENQIPFRVLKDLILLGYGVKKGQEMLRGFLSLNILGVCRQDWKYSTSDENEQLHLIDAFWLILVLDQSHDVRTSSVQDFGFGFLKRVRTPFRYMSKSLRLAGLSRKYDKDKDYGEPEWIKTVKKYSHSYRYVIELKAKGIHFRPQSGQQS